MKFFRVFAVSVLAMSFGGFASAQHGDQQHQDYQAEKERSTQTHEMKRRRPLQEIKRRGPAHHRRFHHRAGRRGPACNFGKLTREQKTQIRSIRKDQASEMVSLRKELKTARKEYRAVITNVDSTLEEAEAAIATVQAKAAELMKARQDAKLKLMYEVLDADQRVKAAKCFKGRHHKKGDHKKAPAKKRGHHGPREG